MPQALLPIIPREATPINEIFSVAKRNGNVYYFSGIHPVFFHPENDHKSFRMFTAQLVCQGGCKQADIIRAFGVSKNSVLRSVKKYREHGGEAFFVKKKGRGGSVLTAAVTANAQELFDSGMNQHEVANELGLKRDTIRKAISSGRLRDFTNTKKK